MTRIACCQLAPRIAELAHNRALALRAIEAADAEIVVLPELVTSGYVFASFEEAASVALAPAELAEWGEAGAELVIGGFCERGEDGRLYNSAAVVDRGGVRAVYRKTHLWDREKLVFTPGDALPPVLETPFGRIGVLICFDLEFPEMPRTLALRGADLIAVPTNWPLLLAPPAGEHPGEVLNAMVAARANGVFVAACDREGTERGVEWTAGTALIGPDGWILGRGRADVDLARAREKALSPLVDLLGDRRPELYAAVAEPPLTR